MRFRPQSKDAGNSARLASSGRERLPRFPMAAYLTTNWNAVERKRRNLFRQCLILFRQRFITGGGAGCFHPSLHHIGPSPQNQMRVIEKNLISQQLHPKASGKPFRQRFAPELEMIIILTFSGLSPKRKERCTTTATSSAKNNSAHQLRHGTKPNPTPNTTSQELSHQRQSLPTCKPTSNYLLSPRLLNAPPCFK